MARLDKVLAVTFDIGGTLIDPWPSVGHVYAAVATEAGFPPYDPSALNRQFVAAWRAKRNFDYSRKAWANLVVSTFGGSQERFGSETPFFAKLYDRFIEATAWQVYPDVRPTLAALRGRGLKLAVISNWDDRLRRLLRNLNLDHCFDTITVSVECSCHKPDGAIFDQTARTLAVPAAAILHVGDSQHEDVDGARAAGFQALLVRRGEPDRGPGEIASLAELLEWVKSDPKSPNQGTQS
jgi:putative hydrolase of the HAD superfamily